MRLLSASDIQQTLNIKKSQFYLMIRQGKFPKAHGSAKLKRWLDVEVDFFLATYCEQPTQSMELLNKQITNERLMEIQRCAERARSR